MFREKILEYLKKVEEYKVVFIWVCALIIVLSILRFSLWATRKNRSQSTKGYIKQLSSKNVEEKKESLYSLGQKNVKQSIPYIEKVLEEDTDVGVKRVAAWSLGSIDKDKLISFLDSKDKDVKDVVMETLIKLDKENVRYMLKKFSSEDVSTKRKILSYVSSADTATYVEELMSIVEKKDELPEIRRESLNMIKLGDIQKIEDRLWNLYYNDEDEEVKRISYEIIQGKRKNNF
jgi:HEAT repeat protein